MTKRDWMFFIAGMVVACIIGALAGCGEACPTNPAAASRDPFTHPRNFVLRDENGCAYVLQVGNGDYENAGGDDVMRWGGRVPFADRRATDPPTPCPALVH